MIDRAIRSLYPNAEFVIEDNDYSKIRWIVAPDNIPTLEELLVEVERIQLQDARLSYRAQRKAEYPFIGDQLDALWKGGEAAAEMAAKILAVKNKYPKG